MGRTGRHPGRARFFWLALLLAASAGGIRPGEPPPDGAIPAEEAPSLPPAPGEEATDPDALPGRDDPEQFYRPPPRPPKRLNKLPA